MQMEIQGLSLDRHKDVAGLCWFIRPQPIDIISIEDLSRRRPWRQYNFPSLYIEYVFTMNEKLSKYNTCCLSIQKFCNIPYNFYPPTSFLHRGMNIIDRNYINMVLNVENDILSESFSYIC